LPPAILLQDGGAARNVGLRLGLSLSLITGRPVKLAGLVDDSLKPRPGLGPGGLTVANAASAVSKGRIKGELGAGELEFAPGGLPRPGDYHFDVAQLQPSPAPYSPILEMLALPLAVAPGRSSVILRGTSHSAVAPTSDELASVLVPSWRALGLDLSYSEIAPGFFPAGGGEAEVTVRPATMLQPLKAEDPFRPLRVGVEVVSSQLPVHMAEQALQGAVDRLAMHGLEATGNLRRARGGKGQALLVWAGDGRMRVGFSTLGKRGARPEALALEAVEALIHFLHSGAALPSGQAARLLLPLACASGVSLFTTSGPPKPWPPPLLLSTPSGRARCACRSPATPRLWRCGSAAATGAAPSKLPYSAKSSLAAPPYSSGNLGSRFSMLAVKPSLASGSRAPMAIISLA